MDVSSIAEYGGYRNLPISSGRLPHDIALTENQPAVTTPRNIPPAGGIQFMSIQQLLDLRERLEIEVYQTAAVRNSALGRGWDTGEWIDPSVALSMQERMRSIIALMWRIDQLLQEAR